MGYLLQRARCVGWRAYRHPHRVIPFIDVNGSARNAAAERTGEKGSSDSDLFRGEWIRHGRIDRAISHHSIDDSNRTRST